MQNKQKKIIVICIAVAILVILEQVLKFIIPKEEKITIIQNFLNISYVQNTGAAFGIGNNNTISFIVISLIVIGLVFRFLIMQIERIDKFILISLVLILAGAIGNLIDRVFRGYVVDFIDITPAISFPIFNLADIYITLGWVLFIIATIIGYVKSEKKGQA